MVQQKLLHFIIITFFFFSPKINTDLDILSEHLEVV